MKAILKQFGLFVVTTVYCLAILTVTAVIVPTAADSTTASLHKPATSPAVANNLFAYLSTAENIADTATHFPEPDTEETTLWSSAAHTAKICKGSAIFYQYTHSANHFSTFYKIARILFPFHFFW